MKIRMTMMIMKIGTMIIMMMMMIKMVRMVTVIFSSYFMVIRGRCPNTEWLILQV